MPVSHTVIVSANEFVLTDATFIDQFQCNSAGTAGVRSVAISVHVTVHRERAWHCKVTVAP